MMYRGRTILSIMLLIASNLSAMQTELLPGDLQDAIRNQDVAQKKLLSDGMQETMLKKLARLRNGNQKKIELLQQCCYRNKPDEVKLLFSEKPLKESQLDKIMQYFLQSVTHLVEVDTHIRMVGPLQKSYGSVNPTAFATSFSWASRMLLVNLFTYNSMQADYQPSREVALLNGNYAWVNQQFALQNIITRKLELVQSNGEIMPTEISDLSVCNLSPDFEYIPSVQDGQFGVLKVAADGTYQPDSFCMLDRNGKKQLLCQKCIAWSPDRKVLFSQGQDRFKIVDIEQGKILFSESIGNELCINMTLSTWLSDTTLLIVAENNDDARSALIVMKMLKAHEGCKEQMKFTRIAEESERIMSVDHYDDCIIYYLRDGVKIITDEGRIVAQKNLNGSFRYDGPGQVCMIDPNALPIFEYHDFEKFFEMRDLLLTVTGMKAKTE